MSKLLCDCGHDQLNHSYGMITEHCYICKCTRFEWHDKEVRTNILTGQEPLEYIITLTNYLFNHGWSTDEMMHIIKEMDKKGVLGLNALRIINGKDMIKE